MKKRTVCFGWTKKFQRRVAHAAELMRVGQHVIATKIVASVKADHHERVKQLRVEVW